VPTPTPNELGDYAPGIVGAVATALLAIKDGWRPFLLTLLIGVAGAWAFKDWAALIGSKFSVPETASGFLAGAIVAHALKKLLDQVAQLEIARPINSAIERWTGAGSEKP
jgi:uncharacterized membrane protein YeaQ/YmgE (transglycosylase-associated protein family)